MTPLCRPSLSAIFVGSLCRQSLSPIFVEFHSVRFPSTTTGHKGGRQRIATKILDEDFRPRLATKTGDEVQEPVSSVTPQFLLRTGMNLITQPVARLSDPNRIVVALMQN